MTHIGITLVPPPLTINWYRYLCSEPELAVEAAKAVLILEPLAVEARLTRLSPLKHRPACLVDHLTVDSVELLRAKRLDLVNTARREALLQHGLTV